MLMSQLWQRPTDGRKVKIELFWNRIRNEDFEITSFALCAAFSSWPWLVIMWGWSISSREVVVSDGGWDGVSHMVCYMGWYMGMVSLIFHIYDMVWYDIAGMIWDGISHILGRDGISHIYDRFATFLASAGLGIFCNASVLFDKLLPSVHSRYLLIIFASCLTSLSLRV